MNIFFIYFCLNYLYLFILLLLDFLLFKTLLLFLILKIQIYKACEIFESQTFLIYTYH